jgi:hypothetical protein
MCFSTSHVQHALLRRRPGKLIWTVAIRKQQLRGPLHSLSCPASLDVTALFLNPAAIGRALGLSDGAN